MGTIDYDPDEIRPIRRALISSADDIGRTALHPAPSGAFGASSLGQQLAGHADAAHTSILATLGRVTSGLNGYADALRRGQNGIQDADDDVRAKVRDIGLAQSQIATPITSTSTGGVSAGQVTASGRPALPDEPPPSTYVHKPGMQ